MSAEMLPQEDVVVKELNKRKSGEAFQLILKKPGQNGDGLSDKNSPLATKRVTPKREVSLEDIQLKMELAEKRRFAKHQAILENAKAEEEKLREAKLKREKATDEFVAQTQESLTKRLSQYEENHTSVLNSKIDKMRSMTKKKESETKAEEKSE